jgi:hypothetical protein
MASRKNPGKLRGVRKPAAPSSVDRDICFVIMPFGGWLDDYYESIYAPAIEAAGLEPHRADDLYRPSTIVNDIWSYTQRAKLLLADLTGKNPNVFYELGLAHALGKPAILVAESMDDIPFDLRALRIIVYDKNDPRWGERLQEKVQTSIAEVLKAPQEAVLPAFLHVRSSAGAPTVTAREKDIIEIKQELDLLRREMRRVPILDEREASRVISGREARARIARYVAVGMSEPIIIRRLLPLGPPEDWIVAEIAKAKMSSTGKPGSVTAAEEALVVDPSAKKTDA